MCSDVSLSGSKCMTLHGKSMPISGLKHCYWPDKFEKQTHDGMHKEVIGCVPIIYGNHACLAYLQSATLLFGNTPNMKRCAVKKIRSPWSTWAWCSSELFYYFSFPCRLIKLFVNAVFYKKSCCLSASNRFLDMASLSFLVYRMSVKTCAKVSLPFTWQKWIFSGRLSFSW